MSKTMFTASTLWQGPYDSEQVVYFAGITQKIFSNLKLENSYDTDYPENTAFKLVGTSNNDLNRIYYPYSTDNLVISNVSLDADYKIDDDKNLVIFPSNYPLTSDDLTLINCKLINNYASIFKSNLVSFDSVNDFSYLKEKAITDMLASDDGIFLSGVSGKIWFYDGDIIKGPIFSAEDGTYLPITNLLKHKFDFEDEYYIYAATDKKPRLYRSKLSTAKNGTEWEEVYPYDELAATSGGILSLTSSFDKIFMGCRNNQVLVFSRTNEITLSEPTDLLTEEIIETNTPVDSLVSYDLKSNNLNDYEPKYSDIKCLSSARNVVFAGLSNKSEIWSYSEINQDNPISFENWVNIYFDEVFKNDPAPAQYYSYDSSTSTRNDNNLATTKFYDPLQKNYIREALVLKGNTISSTGATVNGLRLFEFSDGSDWEQALRLNLPDQEFFEIECATNSEITSLNNITSIDGYELQNHDLILVKNQSSGNEIINGIYRYEYGLLVKYNNLNIVYGSEKLGFYIKNGFINSKSRFFVNIDDFNNDEFILYKSKYSLELELKNLAYSSASACTSLSGCVYLNNLYDNDEKTYSSTAYTGYQGIEIADLYGITNLKFNNDTILMTSGNNQISKTLPSFGTFKNWTFSSTAGTLATTNGWSSYNFISSIAGTTENATDLIGNSYTRYMLRTVPSQFGNPSIRIENLNLIVDQESIVKLRARIIPISSFGFKDSYINFYWSFNNATFQNLTHEKIQTSDDFVEYTFKPIWEGTINNIQIEFENLPDSTDRPSYIDIDYIKIINEDKIFDLNNIFSKVRINVEDRDVKVYLGKQDSPYIYAKNFITLDNYNPKYIDSTLTIENYAKPYVRFGKINNNDGNSLFAFSRMSFIVGDNYSPINKKIISFYDSQKLTSTGGVRMFTYHDGTIYCATDGFDSNNVNINPDDKQSKVFSFDAESSSWSKNDLSFERKQIFNDDGTYNLYGIVRPLNMISYKGLLYLSGQYANIKVT